MDRRSIRVCPIILDKLIKTTTNFVHKKELVSKFGYTCNHLIKHGISHPTFYGNVVNKARKFKQNPHGLKIHLNKLICKGYHHSIVIKYLNMVFIGKNIDFLFNSLIWN